MIYRYLCVLCCIMTICCLLCHANTKNFDTYVKELPFKNKHIIAQGVVRSTMYYRENKVDILTVNKTYNKKLTVEPKLANTNLKGLRSIEQFHNKEKDSLGIVNSTYFNLETGLPIGLLKINDEILTGSVYNRSALVIEGNTYTIERIGMNIHINNTQIDNINQSRMSKYHTILYNNRWGRIAPPIPENGVEVVVDNNLVKKISTNREEIPNTGYVVVGPKQKLLNFNVGDNVILDVDTIPSFKNAQHIVSGGPTVLKNREIYITSKEEKVGGIGEGRYNRTGVCYTGDNTLIIFIVHGKGITLQDEAMLMKTFNCIDGLNLDGGGSTSGYIQNENLVNPSARWLSNVLVVKEVNE